VVPSTGNMQRDAKRGKYSAGIQTQEICSEVPSAGKSAISAWRGRIIKQCKAQDIVEPV